MSSDAFVYTCKSLLNTLGRAVEQLAGCLAKQIMQIKRQQLRSKYNSMQCQREGLKCIMNINDVTVSNRGVRVNLAYPGPAPVASPSALRGWGLGTGYLR